MSPSALDETPVVAPTKGATSRSEPLKLSGALDAFEHIEVTPFIGREYLNVDLVEWLNAPNSAELIRDLAITSEPDISPFNP